jgi:hypothetical protein
MRADLAAQGLIDVDRRPHDRERDREHAEGVAPVFGGLHSLLLYIFRERQSLSAQGRAEFDPKAKFPPRTGLDGYARSRRSAPIG